ncbi:latrophilin-like protein 1 [Anneissia japonica]|uniref:latrophilin-like protein 1 n=1 Tax=Anneissia japonica TaxID=1529436 RepID=UPI0014255274|nr:latrophilin-like protein 1 [Anneissia japonica]
METGSDFMYIVYDTATATQTEDISDGNVQLLMTIESISFESFDIYMCTNPTIRRPGFYMSITPEFYKNGWTSDTSMTTERLTTFTQQTTSSSEQTWSSQMNVRPTSSFTSAETLTSFNSTGLTFPLSTLDFSQTTIQTTYLAVSDQIVQILNYSMSLGSEMSKDDADEILRSIEHILSKDVDHLESNDVSNIIRTLCVIAPLSASPETTVKRFLKVWDDILEEDLLVSTVESGVPSTMLSILESYTATVSENLNSSNFNFTNQNNIDVQIEVIPSDVTWSNKWIPVTTGDESVQALIPTANFKGESELQVSDTYRLNSRELEENQEVVCTYWEFTNSTNGGVWSENGCWVASVLLNQTTCHCTHLTNFAILMRVDKSPKVLSIGNTIALDILTYLLTSLSIICLLLTIFTYVWLKVWRTRRNIIHINLAASLALAQFLYICFIDGTSTRAGCTFIAILLQYLFTVSFAWMLLEGVHLLMNSNINLQHRNPKGYLYVIFGWGPPLVIVLIAFLSKPSSYGTAQSCWLDTSTDIIWAFVTVILLVIAGNIFILLAVIKTFVSLKVNASKSRKERMRNSIRAVLLMIPLMGLTWVFGLIASFGDTIFFTYMFVIFNSSQGIFIFCQLIVFNDEIRRLYFQYYKRNVSIPTVSRHERNHRREGRTSTVQIPPMRRHFKIGLIHAW